MKTKPVLLILLAGLALAGDATARVFVATNSTWHYSKECRRFICAGDEMDVLSQQTGQAGAGVTWDETLRCWRGDAPEWVASLRADRRFRKPVLNTENGYEYLHGHPTEKNQVHHTDKVRRSAWRIVCAGGYFAAGFHGTIGHSDAWNRLDAPNLYNFTVQDEEAAPQLGALYDFFTALPFWQMQPFDGVTGEAAVGSRNQAGSM